MCALGAVVLAAGASERFGGDNKLLATIDGEPLIRRVVRTVLDSGVAELVVVCGYEEDRIMEAVEGLAVRRACNRDWRLGMGTSVAAGIAALRPDLEGAFVVPGDMPYLTRSLLVRLASAFNENGRSAPVFPVTASGDQRNPVLWPRQYYPRLTALSGDQGGKQLLLQLASSAVAVPANHDGELVDLDEIDDLLAVRKLETE
ncbi:MAG: nucleotidyltransferase family protein [Kiloniellales bacterium]|nr:nucleotidyltransferase family protein [Kiloniellales bacterium]